jgi:hypothetical protein
LSERRAANVRDILVKLGMKKELVIAEGFGATQLRTQGTSEDDHQLNRRVEFVVISRDAKPIHLPVPQVPVEGQPSEPPKTPPPAPQGATKPGAVGPVSGEAKP